MSLNRITRRDALFVLGAVAIPQARAEGGLLRATRVDHVALAVGDIEKAMMFYRRLFGSEVLKDSRTPRRYLRLGPCYMAVAFVTDPDGSSVQIWADQSWKGLSNAAPEAGPKQDALFHPRGMHHVAIQVNDMARATEFYRKLFGEPGVGQGDPPQPTFQAGETRILLYNPAPGKPAKIDHFSVLVDNFDAPSAVKVVKELGATAELSRQGTLNEFFDPDGIRLQVTFPGQTYGNTTKK